MTRTRATKAEIQCFDENGKVCDGGSLYLPDYLDWMPIRAKAFWYETRGLGHPDAKHVLFISQGERRLVTITKPLQNLNHHQLKEIDNGLEQAVWDFCSQHGISRTPRNQ